MRQQSGIKYSDTGHGMRQQSGIKCSDTGHATLRRRRMNVHVTSTGYMYIQT